MSSRLESLAEGLRHIYVEPPDSPRKKYFRVIAATEPSWSARHSLWGAWFFARLKGGRVHIHFSAPPSVEIGSVSLDDFRQILLDAEKAIRIGNTAAEIVLERAAEILAQRFRHDQTVFTGPAGSGALLLYRRHYGSDRYSLVSFALNRLLFDGEWVVHAKSVEIELRGKDVSGEELELLRVLAEDLAEIFEAPDLRILNQLRASGSVRAEAEVWREQTRYRGAEAGESP